MYSVKDNVALLAIFAKVFSCPALTQKYIMCTLNIHNNIVSPSNRDIPSANNSVLIPEVSFGERKKVAHALRVLRQELNCVLSRGVSSPVSVLRGTTVNHC